MIKLPQQVLCAISTLENAGYEAYVVGGAVRDCVRGKEAKDWDITTNALPKQVEQVFAGYRLIETGLKHGTVTVLLDSEPLEITTYRIDGDYTDHRRPDQVAFTRSLQEDLARRDFTINALAYNPSRTIVDLYGGMEDMQNEVVRCVGDPDRRFSEDALRILRALRFASVLQFSIEPQTAAAMRRNQKLLHTIAFERIRDELTKLLVGLDAARILQEYADVLAEVLPELVPMFGFEQHNPYHDKNVWLHTVAVVEASSPNPILRWAALLHDIGKPGCFSVDETGKGHFYGHPKQSAELANKILRRLRFDTASRERIVTLVGAHDQVVVAERRCLKRLLHRYGSEATGQLIDLHIADICGQSLLSHSKLEGYRQARQLLEELLLQQTCVSLAQLAVNGRDAMELGFKGREIGEVLNAALEAVLNDEIPNDRQMLLEYLHTLSP